MYITLHVSNVELIKLNLIPIKRNLSFPFCNSFLRTSFFHLWRGWLQWCQLWNEGIIERNRTIRCRNTYVELGCTDWQRNKCFETVDSFFLFLFRKVKQESVVFSFCFETMEQPFFLSHYFERLKWFDWAFLSFQISAWLDIWKAHEVDTLLFLTGLNS